MHKERHGGKKQQKLPVGGGEQAGAEGIGKIRHGGDKHLQGDPNQEGGNHQLVGKMLHFKDGTFHIPHADGVEELGHAKRSKGVGLGAGQYFGNREQALYAVERKRQVIPQQNLHREQQKSSHADAGNQKAVEERAGESALCKEVLFF